MDTMEEVSEDDFRKMGLFKGIMVMIGEGEHTYEFPGDVRYDPFTGEGAERTVRGYTLDDFQDKVMEMVRAN
jgi:hypothetical protein